MVTDRYLAGTRLRLRRVDRSDGTVYRLGQKVRVGPTDPEVVRITNVYLSAEEFAVLATLPAAELRKTRSYVDLDGRAVAVDQFHGRLDGVLLAELELDEDEDRSPSPWFAVRDVTNLATTQPRPCRPVRSVQFHSASLNTRVSNASACNRLISPLVKSPRHS